MPPVSPSLCVAGLRLLSYHGKCLYRFTISPVLLLMAVIFCLPDLKDYETKAFLFKPTSTRLHTPGNRS